jgi:hypothetical protein
VAAYREVMMRLWRTEQVEEPLLLSFSPQADQALRDLETWLEPQLAEGEELSLLAGWANKLTGACARIAGIIHLAGGGTCAVPVSGPTALAAIRLGRDYLLPHAQAAFHLMGADERLAQAQRVWRAVEQISERSERSERTPLRVSRRDLHQGVRSTKSFHTPEEVDPAIELLVDRYYLRPAPPTGRPGRGNKSPEYEVNPKALQLTD